MFFNLNLQNINIAHICGNSLAEHEESRNHFHTDYELLFVSSGDAEFIMENKKCKPAAGDIIFVSPGMIHKIYINQDAPCELYTIRFPESEMPSELLSEVECKAGCYITGTAIKTLFARIDDYLQSYNGNHLEGLLRSVLHEILYHFCSEGAEREPKICNKKIAGVIEYVNANVIKNFVLKDICKSLKCGKSCFCQEFQHTMNISVMKYVRVRKIVLAQSLIIRGGKPKEIYVQCGFDDYSTFFRTYKKILGRTPSLKTGS